ncbi:MAG: trypsin-like peptidase domain-containing protein, partial [Steroidobacteraceae bacterium]
MIQERVGSRAIGALALVAALSACSPGSSTVARAGTAPQSAPATTSPATPATAAVTVAQALPDFAGLVEKFGPAVVNVQVTGKRDASRSRPPQMSPDDPFYEFFRRFGIPNGPGSPGQGPGQGRGGNAPPARGEGSGFIVTPDGYILTNAHVVKDASEVTVRTVDRREYAAKVIGADARTDVAVIKIEGKDLPVVSIGDPSKLKPGQWVVAI